MKDFKLPIAAVITLLLIVGGALFFSQKSSGPDQNSPQTVTLPTNHEYFWGDGCPHCANVAEFFDSWDKKDKVAIDKKEVWNNAINAKLMQERAKYCNIEPSGMGVPFLFTPDGKCLTGDTDIIDYFKNLEL